MKSTRVSRKVRGSALILSLVVMTGLVLIVGGFASSQRAAMRNLQGDLDRIRAQECANAALQRALAEFADVDPNTVTINDAWALLGEPSGNRFVIGSGSARIEIVDAASFVDVNTADEEQLINIGFTQEQVDSLLDWREEGTEPRPEGAKDEYYNGLQEPYNAALNPLKNLSEILLIKGFNPAALYELPEERQSSVTLVNGADEDQPTPYDLITVGTTAPFSGGNGQGRLNVNTATVQQLQQRGFQQQLAQSIIQRRNQLGQYQELGQVLTANGVNLNNAANILNQLMIGNQTEVIGRINLNTATEGVLNSIPGMTADITSSILTQQQTGFTQLGDLTQVPGATVQWLSETVDRFAVGSNVFRIRVVGQYNSVSAPIEAWVTIVNGTPTLRVIENMPYQNMSDRWRWTTEETTDIVLAEDQ